MAANAPYQQMLFVNLAVENLDASKKFFGELGFTFNAQFTDENCACMVVSDTIFVMLLSKERFADFAVRPVADTSKSTEALLCLSAESRAKVDELADAALAAGGSPAKDPQDYGTMYGRSFLDVDGHHWEVMWMDPAAVEATEG